MLWNGSVPDGKRPCAIFTAPVGGNDLTVNRGGDNMTEDEIALHAAINVLPDSIESGRMPSGEPLVPDAAALHERAALHLETLLRRLAVGRLPALSGGNDRQ
jgi:hypothetical protein